MKKTIAEEANETLLLLDGSAADVFPKFLDELSDTAKRGYLSGRDLCDENDDDRKIINPDSE